MVSKQKSKGNFRTFLTIFCFTTKLNLLQFYLTFSRFSGEKKNTQKKVLVDQRIMLIHNPAQESQSLRMSLKLEKGTLKITFKLCSKIFEK